MDRLEHNLKQVTERIRKAEAQYQRSPGSTALLAVSKKQPLASIQRFYRLGVRHFGENYLQEAKEKMAELGDLAIQWHFIGHIQSNKCSEIARHFSWVQSVDRIKIANRLSRQRSAELPPLNICLQVNMQGEATKSGMSPDHLPAATAETRELPNIRLRGLMAIPAPEKAFSRQRQVFSQVKLLFDELRDGHADFDTLSIGMSGDLEAAVAEGSTMVRIGTDLFGPRPES